MAEARITVEYTQLGDGLEQLSALPEPHFVLFSADADPVTGISWCPDCVRCCPAVRGVAADRGASLLEVLVGPRAVWKDPAHPLRSSVGLRGVPDLMVFEAGRPTAAMGAALESAPTPQAAVAAVAAWMAQHGAAGPTAD